MANNMKDFNQTRFNQLLEDYKFYEPIYVTRPTMPSLEKYFTHLKGIWESRWLTNEGDLHKALERRLSEWLGIERLNLFCNGTIALLVALQTLRINSGEVITTPFTFPATPHVLWWNRIQPVFCDINEKTLNIDPEKIPRLISQETKAILPVHVYGLPCDVEAIRQIADIHGLAVIYDAAHAFGVRLKGRSILEHGDLSMMSFHATKLFTTIEGGALVSSTETQKQRINYLKNFGIVDEETVIGPGINGKMNEFQAAFGLLQLEMMEDEICRRRTLALLYREELKDIPGITLLDIPPDVEPNYAYFPILIDETKYGMSRDEVYTALKGFNVFTRKYFYPLCSHFPCYSSLPSANPANLPVAERVAKRVLCLPIYGTLHKDVVKTICAIVKEIPVVK
jgi:dTDP-4-amino-4,6-dideoxygalactose transaminase